MLVMNTSQQSNQCNQYHPATAMSIVNNQLVFHPCLQNKPQHPNGVMVNTQQIMCDKQQQQQQQTSYLQQMQTGQQQQPQQQTTSQFSIPIQLSGAGGVPLDLSSLMQSGCLPPGCLPIQLSSASAVTFSQAPPTEMHQQMSLATFQQAAYPGSDSAVINNGPSNANGGVSNTSPVKPQTSAVANKTPLGATVATTTGRKAPRSRAKKEPRVPDTQTATTVLTGSRFRSVAVQTDFDALLHSRQQIIVVPPKNCTCTLRPETDPNGSGNRKRLKNGKKNQTANQGSYHQSSGDASPELEDVPSDSQSQQQPLYDNRGRPFSYKCLYCPKRFSLNSRLVAHTRCHTGIRPFTCLQCGYSFTQRSYLNRHAAVHKQERPFTCDTCHKTYKHYGSLANHRKLHSTTGGDGGVLNTSGGTDIKEPTSDPGPPQATVLSMLGQQNSGPPVSSVSIPMFPLSACNAPCFSTAHLDHQNSRFLLTAAQQQQVPHGTADTLSFSSQNDGTGMCSTPRATLQF